MPDSNTVLANAIKSQTQAIRDQTKAIHDLGKATKDQTRAIGTLFNILKRNPDYADPNIEPITVPEEEGNNG